MASKFVSLLLELRHSYETNGNMRYSAVALYATDAFLKTSPNSRPSFETHNMILAEFVGIRIISNFELEVKFYYFLYRNISN